MYRVLRSEQVRQVESRAAAQAGLTQAELMRRAGSALARAVTDRVPDGDIIVLCGPGNNGGDGWSCAHELDAAGRRVRVIALRDPDLLEGPARDCAAAAMESGVAWEIGGASPDLSGGAVVVDAVLGTGAGMPLREPLPEWCSAVNRSGAYVVAADMPTGVEADTGRVPGEAISADCTVTFIAPKSGLLMFPGAGHAGEVMLDDLGVPAVLRESGGALEVWGRADYSALVPVPAADTHKNARGRLLIVAGSGAYPGAAVLAARGAMRSGAGYITLAVPEPIVQLMQTHLQAVTVVGLPAGRGKALASSAANPLIDLARDYDAVVLGPGLSLSDGAVACARAVVPRIGKPLLVDADALNALVDAVHLLDARSAPTILTPHPGELARLLNITPQKVQSDRLSSCSTLAGDGRVVVLKGAGTVISDGVRHVVNTSGTPALATAGTGDVLAGMIGALSAQRLQPLEAAGLGVWLHGRAGEIAAGDLTTPCVNAEDVPDRIPAAMMDLLNDW